LEDNLHQLRRQLLTIIYNKNTAQSAYKNNKKSSAYLLFLPKRMQRAALVSKTKRIINCIGCLL
jgi:hypothetical protein